MCEEDGTELPKEKESSAQKDILQQTKLVLSGRINDRQRLLENENKFLQDRIVSLQQELAFLTRREKLENTSKFAIWKEQQINESLKRQLTEFKQLSYKFKQFFNTSERELDRFEILTKARTNAAFLISQIHRLLKKTSSVPIAIEGERRYRKMTETYKETMKACLRQYVLRNGEQDEDISNHDIEHWRPDIDLHKLNAQVRQLQHHNYEKYVRLDVKDVPISRRHLDIITENIDIVSAVVTCWRATGTHFHENLVGQTPWEPPPLIPVGATDAFVPLDVLPEHDPVQNLSLQFSRASEDTGQITSIFSTSLKPEDRNRECFMIHSLVSKFDEEIQDTESKGLFFFRSLRYRQGKSENHTDLTLLVGLKQLFVLMSDEDRITLSEMFRSVGGERFMGENMHPVERGINVFEAILKTSFYICNHFLKWNEDTPLY